jgi:hypothetical protein
MENKSSVLGIFIRQENKGSYWLIFKTWNPSGEHIHKTGKTGICVLADPNLTLSSVTHFGFWLLNLAKLQFLYLESAESKSIHYVKFF